MANGIAALAPDLVCLNGDLRARGNRAVIAAGAGLGTAGLLFDRPSLARRERAVTPTSRRRTTWDELLWFLRAEKRRVEIEDILSDRASSRLPPRADRARRGPRWLGRVSSAIPRRRSRVCSRPLEALRGHARHLHEDLRRAGQEPRPHLATGGVYLGGGIAPVRRSSRQGLPQVSSAAARQPLVEAMPVNVIVNEACSLFGAARSATRLVQRPSGRNRAATCAYSRRRGLARGRAGFADAALA